MKNIIKHHKVFYVIRTRANLVMRTFIKKTDNEHNSKQNTQRNKINSIEADHNILHRRLAINKTNNPPTF